jgi:hypothetical protein
MTIKASGRSALIVATGLWVCLVGPPAAASADSAATSSKSATPPVASKYIKHASHHLKKVAYRKSGKLALKYSAASKAADVAGDTIDNSAALPPSVANANAQLASADSPAGNARAMSARANTILQAAPDNQATDARPAAEAQVISSDQLNDVDRALQDSKAPGSLGAMASADAPAEPSASVTVTRNESSTWDQTSLIGKIFIGFGALLTMASAARMFMA